MKKEAIPGDAIYFWKSEKGDLKQISAVVLSRILFEMFLINEFEHCLLGLKKDDCIWGPVHTSVGQEACAAAAIAALGKEDKIAGTHRAHHQFISKALNYILPGNWFPSTCPFPEAGKEVVRRTMAEIMGLDSGYCRGRGGSMHLRYIEAGIVGTNAIVGGGIPIATGVAYAEKHNSTNNIVVCFLGDGAINQGAFHEACNLAGLWKLPIIYFVENNLYAVGTHVGRSCAVKDLSSRALSYGMDGYVVDGYDVSGIYGTVMHAADRIRKGGCPCIIEAKCYRHYHHAGDQPGSAFGYRDKSEEESWLDKDVVANFPKELISEGILKDLEIEKIREMAKETVIEAAELLTVKTSPRTVKPELWPDLNSTCDGIRSGGGELEDLPYREIESFENFRQTTYSNAIAEITGHWMAKNGNVVEFGEEIANYGGGAYGATKGLPERFPGQIINTPISESGFVGLACGMSMVGMRPIVEIMFPDFALVAADQLFNQIGKARHMYGGATDLPLVVRTRVAIGCGYGGQHSMDPAALYALFPGWRIVAPSNAFDYIGLFNTAMTSNDPVLIIEHHSLYAKKFPVPDSFLDYYIPFGRAKLLTKGKDITILSYGSMSDRMLNMSGKLMEMGIGAEIVDLRSIDMPGIDYDLVGQSLEKTGAVAIVEEGPASQTIGPRLISQIAERFFDCLDGPPGCIASADVPNPVSRILEKAVIISDEQILDFTAKVAKRKWR